MNRGANGYPQGRAPADSLVLPAASWRNIGTGATTPDYCIPGAMIIGTWGTGAVIASRFNLEPWVIPTTTRIDRLAVEVTTAAAAGKIGRIAIIRSDRFWRPLELVPGSDTGAFAVDPGAVPALQENIVDVTLTPGYYQAGFVSDGTPTMRGAPCVVPGWPGVSGVAGNPSHYFQYVTITATASMPAAYNQTQVATGLSTVQASNYVVRARIAA